jgi:hypothetical protein
MPEVSVVMGVYNGAAHLAAAVDSILTQEGVDLEFVVVDDGSTDGTAALLQAYERRDPRVRVIRQENAGLTAALIRGCDEARGIFIARQDADDVSLPGRLAKQADRLSKDASCSFVTCWVNVVGPSGERLKRIECPTDTAEPSQSMAEKMPRVPCHGSVVFRSEAYRRAGGYRRVFYFAQDCDLWLRLAGDGRLACVGEPLYEFRTHLASISSTRRTLQAGFAQLAKDCHRARQRGEPETFWLSEAARLREVAASQRGREPSRREAALTYQLIGSHLLDRGDRRASAYFWRALRTWPCMSGSWRGLAVMALQRDVRVDRAAEDDDARGDGLRP